MAIAGSEAPTLNLLRYASPADPLPPQYRAMPDAERARRTAAARRTLGDSLVVLGHHYQNDEVVEFADFTGDSFLLSKHAAATRSPYIVFCGVTFMAETADIVTGGTRTVVAPSFEAACPMAGMAECVQVLKAWRTFERAFGEDGILPVTYMNSYADLKAFTGEKGGVVCTSSNADRAMRWAFDRADRVVFLPDQHLGRNMALRLGRRDEEMVVWNPWKPGGGVSDERLREARVVLWEGYCQVHERFRLHHVDEARAKHPGIRVVVHPECRREVVEAADLVGSTETIVRAVRESPSGSAWAVGTEIHLVKRLARQNPDKTVVQLCGDACLDCSAMRQVDPRYLCWVLEELAEGRVVNRVRVDPAHRRWAEVALERMLTL